MCSGEREAGDIMSLELPQMMHPTACGQPAGADLRAPCQRNVQERKDYLQKGGCWQEGTGKGVHGASVEQSTAPAHMKKPC